MNVTIKVEFNRKGARYDFTVETAQSWCCNQSLTTALDYVGVPEHLHDSIIDKVSESWIKETLEFNY